MREHQPWQFFGDSVGIAWKWKDGNSVNIVPLKGIYLQINNNIETMVGVLQAFWFFFSVFYNKEDCSR